MDLPPRPARHDNGCLSQAALAAGLARRPGHRPATQYVRVHVVDRLPGLRARIEHHSVAGVGDAFCDRHLPGVGDELRQQVIASLAQLSEVRVVDPRDYQHMDRRLGIYVSKGNCA